jgi:hypothetical protein
VVVRCTAAAVRWFLHRLVPGSHTSLHSTISHQCGTPFSVLLPCCCWPPPCQAASSSALGSALPATSSCLWVTRREAGRCVCVLWAAAGLVPVRWCLRPGGTRRHQPALVELLPVAVQLPVDAGQLVRQLGELLARRSLRAACKRACAVHWPHARAASHAQPPVCVLHMHHTPNTPTSSWTMLASAASIADIVRAWWLGATRWRLARRAVACWYGVLTNTVLGLATLQHCTISRCGHRCMTPSACPHTRSHTRHARPTHHSHSLDAVLGSLWRSMQPGSWCGLW